MTPNEIEILLHCHVTIARHPRFEAPAVQEAIELFLACGIIEPHMTAGQKNEIYRTTLKGQALVKVLCSVPFPTQKWVDKDGNVIDL